MDTSGRIDPVQTGREDHRWILWDVGATGESNADVRFMIPDDLWPMFDTWFETPTSQDGHLSGVIADWIEDHAATGRAINTPRAVELAIKTMRENYADPRRNRRHRR
jgi:hypothetical protein